MQKRVTTATATFMFLSIFIGLLWFGSTPVAAAEVIRVRMADRFVDFEGQQPVIIDGRTLVPVRGVFTLMGFEPVWDSSTSTATLSSDTTTIIIPVGRPSFTVNGRTIFPDVPAQNISGRVLIPLRAIVEAIDGDAIWDRDGRIAIIIPPDDLMDVVLYNLATLPAAPIPIPPPGQPSPQPAPPSQPPQQPATPAQPATGQSHTVTFRSNGGSGSMQPQTFEQGVAQSLRTNTFTRNRYAFVGWSLTADGAVIYQDGAVFTATANQTLYAVWQELPPVITSNTLNDGVTRRNYSQTLRVEGASSVTWAIAQGDLPDGLSLHADTGAITGMPTRAGVFLFTVAATNAGGTTTSQLSITVEPGREEPFIYTTSEIELPNRRLSSQEQQAWIDEYNAMGGASAWEIETIRLINEERRQHGLDPLALDRGLMMASRFYAQTLSNLDLNLGHRYGPYGGSGGTASAFDASWNTANGNAGRWTPEAAVQGWMNSPGHRANILNPRVRFIGLGAQLGGRWGVFAYSLQSINPSQHGAYQPGAQPNQPAAQTRTITFRANGGTGNMPNQTIPHGVATALNPNTFTRANHIFAGWATTANGPVVYTDAQSISATANRTLHAVWESTALPTFTITFRANGGTGNMPNQTFQRDILQHLNANTFTRAGHEFVGWGTSAGGAVVYGDTQSISITANRALYAVWQPVAPVTFTVTFVANDGGSATTTQTFTQGNAQTLRENTFTRAGFIFVGWALAPNGSVHYTDQQHVSITQNQRFYAIWESIGQVSGANGVVTIQYNANGGSGAPNSHTVTKDNDGVVIFGLSTAVPTRPGYTFIGWRFENDIAYDIDAPGQNINFDTGSRIGDEIFTYFAQWYQAPTGNGVVTIQYNANGGSGAPNSHTATKDNDGIVNFWLSNTVPTRPGYIFIGWRFENDIAYDIDAPGQNINFGTGNRAGDEIFTYFAQWIRA